MKVETGGMHYGQADVVPIGEEEDEDDDEEDNDENNRLDGDEVKYILQNNN